MPSSDPSDESPILAVVSVFRTLAVASALAIGQSAVATEVWAVTDAQHPVRTDATVRLIELDAPPRIRAQLAAHLPPDPKRAAALVEQRLKQGGPAFQQDLAKAYQGVVDAWRLGVSKIPAIVVDQHYVVYGEANVARAVAWVEQYRRSQK